MLLGLKAESREQKYMFHLFYSGMILGKMMDGNILFDIMQFTRIDSG